MYLKGLLAALLLTSIMMLGSCTPIPKLVKGDPVDTVPLREKGAISITAALSIGGGAAGGLDNFTSGLNRLFVSIDSLQVYKYADRMYPTGIGGYYLLDPGEYKIRIFYGKHYKDVWTHTVAQDYEIDVKPKDFVSYQLEQEHSGGEYDNKTNFKRLRAFSPTCFNAFLHSLETGMYGYELVRLNSSNLSKLKNSTIINEFQDWENTFLEKVGGVQRYHRYFELLDNGIIEPEIDTWESNQPPPEQK